MKRAESVNKSKDKPKIGWKEFFRPTIWKVSLFIMVIFYAFYIFSVDFYGHIYSLAPLMIFFLPLKVFGKFALVLVIPYIYIIACLFVFLFKNLKNKKWLLI